MGEEERMMVVVTRELGKKNGEKEREKGGEGECWIERIAKAGDRRKRDDVMW